MRRLLLLLLTATLSGIVSAKEPPEVEMRDRQLVNVIGWAELGNRDALADLCMRYKTGQGAAKSDADALLRCTDGAKAGLPSSQTWLGDLYFAGGAGVRDYRKAFEWYSKAAAAGQAQAKYSLYQMLDQGLGVHADAAAAARWLHEAGEGGDLQAIETLKKTDPSWARKVVPEVAPLVQYVKEQDLLRFVGDPGHFTSAFYRIDAAPLRRVDIVLKEFKSDPRWAPMLSVCLGTEGPGEFACLKLGRTYSDSEVLNANVSTLSADQNTEHDRSELPGEFRLGKLINLGVAVDDTFLQVSIDGKLVSVHKLSFRPELIRLGCSTAVCEFKLN